MPTALEKYEDYVLNNPVGERIVEVIEISHPDIEPIYLAREPESLTVTLEDNSIVQTKGVNMVISRASSEDDLDEKFAFDIEDIYGEAQDILSNIEVNDNTSLNIIYRLYMASDLTEISIGPYVLQVTNISFTKGRFSMQAESPSLVRSRTGELYTYDRFPMLRAFL